MLDCLDDGLHAGGNLTVENGEINIMTGDDGAHSDAELIINGGNLNVSRSYEGLCNEIGQAGDHITLGKDRGDDIGSSNLKNGGDIY